MEPQTFEAHVAIKAGANLPLNEDEAAAVLGLSPITLANWRHQGKGPKCKRIGLRAIRYLPRDLIAFRDGEPAAQEAAA